MHFHIQISREFHYGIFPCVCIVVLFLTSLISDKSCTAIMTHFNFNMELDFVFHQRLQTAGIHCASLNFNSISFFTHPVLCTKSRSVLCGPMEINLNKYIWKILLIFTPSKSYFICLSNEILYALFSRKMREYIASTKKFHKNFRRKEMPFFGLKCWLSQLKTKMKINCRSLNLIKRSRIYVNFLHSGFPLALSSVSTSHFKFPSAKRFDFEQSFLTDGHSVIFGRMDIRTI